MEREQIVCRCLGVTYGQIEDAVKEGRTTYQEVFRRIPFGVGCGGCRSRIKQMIYLISEELKQQKQ